MPQSTSNVKTEIQDAFKSGGLRNVRNDVLSKCIAPSANNNISPDQLAISWKADAMEKNIAHLSKNTVPAFQNAVIKENEIPIDPAVQTRKRHAVPHITKKKIE